jgi:hypothetical protein
MPAMKEELQGLLLQAKQMESEQYERLNTVGHPNIRGYEQLPVNTVKLTNKR